MDGRTRTQNYLKTLIVALVISLATISSPIASPRIPKHSADDKCLANAIFFEARGEPLAGRRAVFEIIQNRMLDTGKSACSIIRERNQFSFVKHHAMMPMTYELQEMLREVKGSHSILINEKHGNQYKHFHSGEKPYWAHSMICKKIHRHNFCRHKEK